MKVSVVITAYNEEAYIGSCLDHLTNQIEPADEIIIVDNNCTDSTVAIAQQYPVRIINEPEQGVIPARNTGFEQAQYEIIARTDSDSRVPPDWIQRIKHDMHLHQPDAIAGPVRFYDLPLIRPFFSEMIMDSMAVMTGGKQVLYGPNMAITQNIWDQIADHLSEDAQHVHEDFDLGIKISRIGGKIYRDSRLVVPISARRIRTNPASFFIGYGVKNLTTVLYS